MRKKTRLTGLVVAVAMLGFTVGARVVVADPSTNSQVRGVVLFVGDSNITLGATSIDWALTWQAHNDNGYVPIMESRVGSTIRTPDCLVVTGCATTDYWKTKLAETFPRIHPDAIVNNLGINDTNVLGTTTSPGYAHYGHKIDWFMSFVPRTTPVLWTNLPCAIEPPNRLLGCRLVNQGLANATARWPNLWVLDWAQSANGHPGYMASPGLDVHLSNAGQGAWTTLVLNLLDARFPSP